MSISSKLEWQEISKSGLRPNGTPSAPDVIYKGKGWISWQHWFGREFLPFHEAREIARKLAANDEVTTFKEWRRAFRYGRLPLGLPSNPSAIYREHWLGYPDWFGRTDLRKKNWLPFEEARRIVVAMGIKSKESWSNKSIHGKRPPGIPSNPDIVYKKEWKGWAYWLKGS
jgi:hypothetical protein